MRRNSKAADGVQVAFTIQHDAPAGETYTYHFKDAKRLRSADESRFQPDENLMKNLQLSRRPCPLGIMMRPSVMKQCGKFICASISEFLADRDFGASFRRRAG